MPNINIKIENKVAKQVGDDYIVCHNKDYVVVFAFDSEWDNENIKTAIFSYNGKSEEVVFEGNSCEIPMITNTQSLAIGVFAGDLRTTTNAYVPCKYSALEDKGVPPAPQDDIYGQIIELLNKYIQQGGGGLTEEELVNLGFVKDTDYASETKYGLVKTFYNKYSSGLEFRNNMLLIYPASKGDIDTKSPTSALPITPQNLDYAVKVGLTTNKETLTDEEKAYAQEWLGIESGGSGGTWYEDINSGFYFLDMGMDMSAIVSQTTLGNPTQVRLDNIVWSTFDLIVNGERLDASNYSLSISNSTPFLVTVEDAIFGGGIPEEYQVHGKEFTVKSFATFKEKSTNRVISETVPFSMTFAYGDLSNDGKTRLGFTTYYVEWQNDTYSIYANEAGYHPTCTVSLLVEN